MDELSLDLHTKKPPQIARRPRIHCSSHDRHGPQPLYSAIVTRARQAKLAGATSRIGDIASENPTAIELSDTVEKSEAFVARLERWIGAAMITFEEINVVYRAAKAP